MADNSNGLVLNNNDNGTKSAEWTPFDEIPADKKVLMGVKDPLSGNMVASWEDAPVTPGVEFAAEPSAFTLVKNIRNLSVDVPEGVTSIDSSAFEYCVGLKSIAFPESGLTTIGNSAFKDCSELVKIDVPGSVTRIGNNSFMRCTSLADVTLNEGVGSIGSSAFYGCTELESVDIPASVTEIGSSAFYGCTNLATITIHKAEGSITGSPWGAGEGTQIIWDGE